MAAQRIFFVAHGRVQGVNFRYFTQKKATEYRITGWCRNTDEATVEGEAQGEEDVIKRFLKDVNNGPPHARVVKVETQPRDLQEGETAFEVRR
ncbi:hypothetical protein DL766_010318 [Monosporascus sp. MC13-8B]|uniref:acylphosphatase n=1 Tax=Monosporascus cannonballus TaxID=155416 RepID=A0ABY0HFA1_9PEZI|nr:hypothetical protein DL763_006457 [Monosporascus cannonballus]RYO89142.1 hypothetical protein DL762_003422 [Monosporascus cannonballus]RYP02491.1 hypothetical protein DL766_010318 [Monosporascus sp. MC13-8B]